MCRVKSSMLLLLILMNVGCSFVEERHPSSEYLCFPSSIIGPCLMQCSEDLNTYILVLNLHHGVRVDWGTNKRTGNFELKGGTKVPLKRNTIYVVSQDLKKVVGQEPANARNLFSLLRSVGKRTDLGEDSNDVCPKERSCRSAMTILGDVNSAKVLDRIKALDDVDALRIIAFTARATAWTMEAGPNVEFDNKMDGITMTAIGRLHAIDSDEANDSIDCYKRAFPPDGAYSLFFKEWEEGRKPLRSKRDSDTRESKSAIISPRNHLP